MNKMKNLHATKGIYKFTNKANGKSYIGQSIYLEERYKQHQRNYNNKNHSSYNSKFYSALRKYGFNNFDYEILYSTQDEITYEELNTLEVMYVAYYDSFQNGYNMNPGGNNTGGHYFIPFEKVLEIKELLKNSSITLTEISKQYKTSICVISGINKGYCYAIVGDYKYPIRAHEEMKKTQQGENNGRAIFTDKEVLQMREQFQNKSLTDLYNEYQNQISFSALKKIIYGVNYTHLPIYKKREKKWYLNGTCIDYPRVEEQDNQ